MDLYRAGQGLGEAAQGEFGGADGGGTAAGLHPGTKSTKTRTPIILRNGLPPSGAMTERAAKGMSAGSGQENQENNGCPGTRLPRCPAFHEHGAPASIGIRNPWVRVGGQRVRGVGTGALTAVRWDLVLYVVGMPRLCWEAA